MSVHLTRSPRALARAAFVLLPLLGACATTGATLNSGVGDAFLERPPYYAGQVVTPGAGRIAHLPVGYARGQSQADIFDPEGGTGTPVDALLREMNAYLDSLGVTARVQAVPSGTAPNVRFGCPTDGLDDCAERGDSALGRGDQTMHLAVGRPSKEWIANADAALTQANADRLLVITLEVGQYLMRQEGWRGNKVLEMGTGYRVPLPWLTSLETPVSVLQLTGALVGRDGKAIRIGAEGIMARRTSFGISVLGAQRVISDSDVQAARTLRREDLPGQPLAWKVALGHLVSQLTGTSSR